MDTNTNTPSTAENAESVVIIEEKITKAGSDPIIRKYSKGKLLGKGGFAKCYEIVNLENKKVLAAKIIVKSTLTKSRAKQKLISEIKIHKSLRHPNVVSFEHVFEDQENVYILLELCSHQSLHDLLKRRKRLTELEVQCYAIQLINGLKYLHSRRVIHRDLKLGNLFLNEKMELKLGDFGLAAKLEFDGERRRTVCGTPNYIAPEVIEGKGGHSYEVDIWSFGVILYTLLVGRPPFETSDVKLTYKKIKAVDYAFPETVSVSEIAKDLISKILNLDPSKRPSLEEILQHPFLKNGQNIPKFLPVSTLACPPSNGYLNQFSSLESTTKIPLQPPKTADTNVVGIKGGRFLLNSQRSNLMGPEKTIPTSPHSATTQTHTNENIIVASQLERQPTREKGWNFTKPVSLQSTLTSAPSLKDTSRPHTVQQRDFKSTQSMNTINNLGSRLRESGVVIGSRGKIGHNEVCVRKWLDYSSKYGMAYALSNGSTGVFFNDNTKILLDTKGIQFDYIHRNPSENQDILVTHTLTDYPKDLQKKVTLLQHFKRCLEGNSRASPEINSQCINDDDVINAGAYVKKWVKTKNAIMFRLSNKMVQVNFTDKTEILLNSETKQVAYVNKKGERSNYALSTAMESANMDMTKRLKYTKDLLSSLINGTSQHSQIPTLNLQ